METTGILQVGAGGPVAEKFREIASNPDFPFEIEAVVTASHPELVNQKLGQTGLKYFSGQEDVPVIGIDDAIKGFESLAVFSSLQSKAAEEYEDQLAQGKLLATNAAPNRMRPDVALLNAYINGDQLDELFADKARQSYIMANGNCTSIILSIPLAPLHRQIGVESLKVETLQGWSGAGLAEVPEEVDPITDIVGDEKSKIENEPNKFLGSMQEHAGINISAVPKRGPWLNGHHERVTVQFNRATSAAELKEVLRSQRGPDELKGVDYDKYSPKRKPIKVVKKELLVYGDAGPKSIVSLKPMKVLVHIKEFDPEEPTRAVLEIAGDNIGLGAAGASAMNLVYAKAKGEL